MKKIVISVVICLVVLGASIGVLQWKSQNTDTNKMVDVTKDNTPNNDSIITAPSVPNNPRVENGAFVIGATDAPITIEEFSSFSCPHCATFHEKILHDLKKDYIDSGKVKFIFNDFPLNKAAVDASLLIKCINNDKRFEFMELLFSQQSQWATDTNPQTKLKQYASLLGLSNDKADACMMNEDAERNMFESMQKANVKHQISSTPTFVISPSNKIIKGAQNYGAFSVEIERLLKEAK